MATIVIPNTITVTHEELDGSPVSSLDENGSSSTRLLKCAWDDRETLQDQILGSRRWEPIDGGPFPGNQGTLTITLAQQNPHSTAIQRAMKVGIKPLAGAIDDPSSLSTKPKIKYEHAQLTVEYQLINTTTTEEGERESTQETLRPSAEFITLPGKELYWDPTQTELLTDEDAPGQLVRLMEWVYSIAPSIRIPDETLDLLGKVNDAELVSSEILTTSGPLTFAAETLLYNGPSLGRRVVGTSEYSWRTELVFLWRQNGWNKFPHLVNNEIIWQNIYDGSGNIVKPYTPADLTPLLVR